MEDLFKLDMILPIAVGIGAVMLFRFIPRMQMKKLGIGFIDSDEAKQKLDQNKNVLVLDVRTPGEFTGNLGHIKGALNLDSGSLSQKLSTLGEELDAYRDTPVLLFCRTHNRSPKAAKALANRGFNQLFVVNNGMSGWNRAGYPVTGKA